jgi:nicotinamidase-related amidase
VTPAHHAGQEGITAMQAYIYGEKCELPDGFAEFLDKSRTAVVSIDMHTGHLADTPDCPCPAPRGREIVAPIDRFHEGARKLGVPVIHVRAGLRESGVDDVEGIPAAWRLVFPLHVGEIVNTDEHAIEGSPWTEFETAVNPRDEIVTTKKRLTPFYPTDLDFLLRNMDVRTVVLNGIMADCCVLNAAFDASNLNYRVVVARDLTRGTNAEMEDAAMKVVSLHLGLVVESGDLLAEWGGTSAAQAAE